MMFGWSLAAIILLPLSTAIKLPGGSLPPAEFEHRAILDQDDKVVMLWTPLEKTIHIEVQVATTGYIGLGFSPNGGMTGADIILAWVDDFTGELNVHDRYAQGPMTPMIDDVQDITVVGGYQNESHTVLRFSRPWNTCDDDQDYKLSKDTVRVIWSYSYEDPMGDMVMKKHDKRGAKSIYLQEPRFSMPSFPPDVKNLDFVVDKIRLPDDKDTMYWDKMFKIPDLQSKHHIIGFVPVIQHFEHVHHMILYECHLQNSSFHLEKWLSSPGIETYSPNMPLTWKYCTHIVIGWAIGSEGDLYPEHVGIPLGEKYGGSDYYRLQIHYDNPDIKKGIVDSSGVRLFYTDNLREIDGGVMIVGSGVGPTMVIPPHQGWKMTGMCSGECTRQLFPKDGIKVFMALLHAHYLGRALTLRQIRNGVELPTIFEDKNYDFNYQQGRIAMEPMHVLPGDTLIVECTFDSMRKSKTTFGGDGTDEEMCQIVLTYYPKMELSYCESQPLLPNVFKSIGINELYDEEKHLKKIPINREAGYPEAEEVQNSDMTFLRDSDVLKMVFTKSPKEYQNRTLYDILNDDSTWKNPKTVAKLHEQLNYGTQLVSCPLASRSNPLSKKIPKTMKYPDYVSFKPLQDDECKTVYKEEVYISYESVDSPKVPAYKPSKIPESKDRNVAASGSKAVLSYLLIGLTLLYHTYE